MTKQTVKDLLGTFSHIIKFMKGQRVLNGEFDKRLIELENKLHIHETCQHEWKDMFFVNEPDPTFVKATSSYLKCSKCGLLKMNQ